MASLIILEGPKYSGKTFIRNKLHSLGFKTLCVEYSDVEQASFWKNRESSEEETSFMLGSYVMMMETWSLGYDLVSDRNFLSACFYHKTEIEGKYFDLWINAINKWDQKCIYVLSSADYEEENKRINKRNNCSEDSMYSYYYRQEEKHFFSSIKSRFIDNPLFYFGSSEEIWDDITKKIGAKSV